MKMKERNNRIDSLDTLYFGVVAHLLMYFANYNNGFGDISLYKLVSRYIACVAKKTDDVNKQCKLLRANANNKDEVIINLGVGNGFDSSALSKIMTGERRFHLKIAYEDIDIGGFLERYEIVSNSPRPWFNDEDKPIIMLSLFDIMKKDKYILNNDTALNRFKRFIYKESGEYYFPEFLVGVLLYTAFNETVKTDECKYAESICATLNMEEKGIERYLKAGNHVITHIQKIRDNYPPEYYKWDSEKQSFKIENEAVFLVGSLDGVKKENIIEVCYQNENPSEDNCEENNIVTEETSASKVDGFTEGNLISEEMREQITKEPFSDTEKKSNSKPQKKSKKEANVPDIYKICRFCKRFKPDTNNDSEEGDCSVYDKKVRMDQIACENYKHDMNAIIDYEKHLPPGEGHM